MVGARDIVANGFGGVCAEEDRAGIAHLARELLRIARLDLQVLRGDGISKRHGIVKFRTVLLIARLAIVRKLMIIDLSAAEAQQVFALAAAILALGAVYWLVREQDRREQT